jgi:hypothetical protein
MWIFLLSNTLEFGIRHNVKSLSQFRGFYELASPPQGLSSRIARTPILCAVDKAGATEHETAPVAMSTINRRHLEFFNPSMSILLLLGCPRSRKSQTFRSEEHGEKPQPDPPQYRPTHRGWQEAKWPNALKYGLSSTGSFFPVKTRCNTKYCFAASSMTSSRWALHRNVWSRCSRSNFGIYGA